MCKIGFVPWKFHGSNLQAIKGTYEEKLAGHKHSVDKAPKH